jgi:hypothetical protein
MQSEDNLEQWKPELDARLGSDGWLTEDELIGVLGERWGQRWPDVDFAAAAAAAFIEDQGAVGTCHKAARKNAVRERIDLFRRST